jgi:type I restriction enzyme M protein
VAARGDNLDISWLKDDDATGADELPEPEEIASQIRERLSTALEEMDALVGILEGDDNELETTP